MADIMHVFAREILDSRGNPTVEAEVHLDDFSVVSPVFPRVHPPVFTRHTNFGTVGIATKARAS